MVSSLARSKYCQKNCWRDEDCVSDVHFDKGHPYMMSEQKGGGGSRTTQNLRTKSMDFADKEGEGVKKSPNFVECSGNTKTKKHS